MDFRKLPIITASLLAISLYVAFISRLGIDLEAIRPFFISWYFNQGLPEVRHGEIWRLVTPIFIHFGLMHLAFNLIMTWQLGELLERSFGALRFTALVVALAVISNLAQFFTTGPLFGGLSGVLYGLFGYFWIASRFNPLFAYRINPGAVKMLLIWFVLCWFDFFGLLGNIKVANMAHTGGLLLGMLLAFIGALSSRARLRNRG